MLKPDWIKRKLEIYFERVEDPLLEKEQEEIFLVSVHGSHACAGLAGITHPPETIEISLKVRTIPD